MEKWMAAISLSRKAGKLVWGFDTVKEAVLKGTAKLVVLSEELSPKTKKEVRFLAEKDRVKILELPVKIDEIWYLIGKKAGVLAITDVGLAEKLLETAEHR